jgi:hypothetical protein
MKISSAYPYPVLYMNNDDYIDSSFSTGIEVAESFGEVKINAHFQLDNNGVKELIHHQKAVFLIHVECGQTSFRQAYESFNDSLEISIPSSNLRGKIQIHSFVIAKDRITDYTNDSLSDWYKGFPITFEKGNFIAIGEAIETTLFEDNAELLNLPSIITVSKSQKKEFMEVDLNSNNITIALPEYEYNQYAGNANSRLKNTILSAVFMPALVYIFSKIKDSQGDFEEYTWYQVLDKIFDENNHKLEDVGSDTFSALKAAQLVLRKPLKTSFEEIEKLNRAED